MFTQEKMLRHFQRVQNDATAVGSNTVTLNWTSDADLAGAGELWLESFGQVWKHGLQLGTEVVFTQGGVTKLRLYYSSTGHPTWFHFPNPVKFLKADGNVTVTMTYSQATTAVERTTHLLGFTRTKPAVS